MQKKSTEVTKSSLVAEIPRLPNFSMYLSNEKRYSSHTINAYLRDLNMFFRMS